MGWTPAYNAYGAEPLVRQMLAIINRDIQDALDFVSGVAGSLQPFATYQLAESVTQNFPAIMMMPLLQKFDPEVMPVAQQEIPIYCAVAAAHQQPNQVAILVQRYAMAVWHVLTAAWIKTPTDWGTAGLALPASAYGPGQTTAGLANAKLNRMYVAQPQYGELRQTAKSAFVKAASMTIECELSET